MSAWAEDLWRPEGPRGWTSHLIAPAALAAAGLYDLGLQVRRGLYRLGIFHAELAPIPILSIGGIEAGGVGKTPLALELLRLASEAGLGPAILTRGYGAQSSRGVVLVPAPAGPDAARRYGDEPVWLAENARAYSGTVWIARRRLLAARAAAAAGARFGILDDGLQHWPLLRDGEVVCLSGSAPLANGRLLPAGPLRERPIEALARADRVVLSGVGAAEAACAATLVRPLLRASVPIDSWQGRPSVEAVAGAPPASGEPVHLIAGIAHPERLRASLSALGHPIERMLLFPDHHSYREQDLRPLLDRTADGPAIPWVTTEKDWVRLRPWAMHEGLRLAILRQTLVWNDPAAPARWRAWMEELATRRNGVRA